MLDVESKEGVDVVGDARDPGVLEQAGIEDASALLLTVGDDTTAVLATLIASERHPDTRILVRANEEANVAKLSRAGADYQETRDVSTVWTASRPPTASRSAVAYLLAVVRPHSRTTSDITTRTPPVSRTWRRFDVSIPRSVTPAARRLVRASRFSA